MAFYAIYKKQSGEIVKTIEAPDWLIASMPIASDEAILETQRQARDAGEYIKGGKLVPKPDVDNSP